jgi:hypothetical protein
MIHNRGHGNRLFEQNAAIHPNGSTEVEVMKLRCKLSVTRFPCHRSLEAPLGPTALWQVALGMHGL